MPPRLSDRLKKLGLSRDEAPSLSQWQAFLDEVCEERRAQDACANERPISVSSREIGESIRRAEMSSKALVEHLPDPVFVHRGFQLHYVNPAMVRLLGYETADDLLMRNALEVVHPDDRALLVTYAERRARGEPAITPRVRWVTRTGETLDIESTFARAVYDDEDSILVIARDVTEKLRIEAERRKTADELRVSEERYRTIFDGSPLSMMVFDPETFQILVVNDAATRVYGYTREEFLGLRLFDLKLAEEMPSLIEGMAKVRAAPAFDLSTASVWHGERKHRRKDGVLIDLEITSHAVTIDERRLMLCVARDVSKLRELEEQLRQSQKMEGIGLLAGGIAHDFNNILSIILSHAELMLDDAPEGGTLRSDIDEIMRAATRAVDLTKKLLAFGRKQILAPRVIDLGRVVGGMETMLRRVLGEAIDLTTDVEDGAGMVRADPGQIEQVIMNLVVNARDAVGGAGHVRIVVANAARMPGTEPIPELAPHGAVKLSVIDDGQGMDAATRARIFEPFFTTKEMGKGTGLGLSTVFGIVKQSGGHVRVESELGRGTTFEIFLPRAPDAQRTRSTPPPAADRRKRACETVLLVEDEDGLRSVAHDILRRSGYMVLAARNAGEALLICEKFAGEIQVLVTDVVMPHMGGAELAKRVRALRPNIRVLYMSGYTDDAVVRQGVLVDTISFLQKPLTPGALTRKVREVLDGPPTH